MIDQLVEDRRQMTDSASELIESNAEATAGFSEMTMAMVSVSENLLQLINVLGENGGKVNSDGTTGGAVTVTMDEGQWDVLKDAEDKVDYMTNRITSVLEEKITALIKSTDETKEAVKSEGRKNRDEMKRSGGGGGKETGLLESVTGVSSKDIMSGAGDIESLMKGIGSGNLGGISKALGGLGKMLPVLGTVGSVVGIGAAVGSAIGQGIDVYQGARAASIEQGGDGSDLGLGASMSAQSKLLGYTTGMDEQQIQAVQRGLVSGRAKYGTEEYDQGMQFAMRANMDYNMDPTKATKLYTDTVVKGGASMAELNSVMENLAETVKNTDVSMEEATKNFQEQMDSWTKAVGGNTATGMEYANQMQMIFQNSDDANAAANMVGSIDWVNDMRANTLKIQYMEGGMSESEAMLQVAMDNQRSGVGFKDRPSIMLAKQPLPGSGMTFWEMVDSGDKEGLVKALEAVQTDATWQDVGGLAGIRTALSGMGYNADKLSDPQSIADEVMRFEEGATHIEDQTLANTYGSEGWSKIKGDIDGVKSNIGASSLSAYTVLASGQDDLDRAVLQGEVTADNLDGRARDRIISLAASDGLISDQLGENLNDEATRQIAQSMLQAYQYSGGKDGDYRYFSDWMNAEENRGKIDEIMSDYEKYADSGQASNIDQSIKIGFVDGAAEVLYAQMEAVDKQRGRDKGSDY